MSDPNVHPCRHDMGLDTPLGSHSHPCRHDIAAGGSARSGLRYLIGEHGPELFVPTTSGNIYRFPPLRRESRLRAFVRRLRR